MREGLIHLQHVVSTDIAAPATATARAGDGSIPTSVRPALSTLWRLPPQVQHHGARGSGSIFAELVGEGQGQGHEAMSQTRLDL